MHARHFRRFMITGLIVGLAFGLNGCASSGGESTEAPTLVPVQG